MSSDAQCGGSRRCSTFELIAGQVTPPRIGTEGLRGTRRAGTVRRASVQVTATASVGARHIGLGTSIATHPHRRCARIPAATPTRRHPRFDGRQAVVEEEALRHSGRSGRRCDPDQCLLRRLGLERHRRPDCGHSASHNRAHHNNRSDQHSHHNVDNHHCRPSQLTGLQRRSDRRRSPCARPSTRRHRHHTRRLRARRLHRRRLGRLRRRLPIRPPRDPHRRLPRPRRVPRRRMRRRRPAAGTTRGPTPNTPPPTPSRSTT